RAAIGEGDENLAGGAGAQPDISSRSTPGGPMRPFEPGSLTHFEDVVERQTSDSVVEVLVPEPVIIVNQGPFVGRAAQVRVEYEGVRRVHDRRFGPACEHFVGMAQEMVI